MFTKEMLTAQLRQMGIRPDDTVLIHTSLKAVGQVEGGADGLIDVFREYLSQGLFLVPTHTWATVNRDNPYFDVRSAVPCIGTLPRVAVQRTDGVRSLHPTHSMKAWGREAEDFVRGEEDAGSPGAPGHCWDKLADRHAKILLIGVNHGKDTFIHSVDERAGLPDRVSTESFQVTITDRGGNRMVRPLRWHQCSRTPDVSQFYVNFEKPLLELGAQTFGQLGNAEVRVVDAAKAQQIILRIYSRAKSDIFTEIHELPEELYRDGV